MHIEVDLQPVEVQVKDSRGNNVFGLSAKDFTIAENGRPQKIAFFDSGSGPVSLAVLLDSSNSIGTGGALGSAESIAGQFMRLGRPGDDISAMDFTDQQGPWEHLTREQLLNPSSASLAIAPSHGSALYDAVASALCHLRSSKNPRQAIIVVSDADDQHSRISLDQLAGLVRTSPAQLFMIGLPSMPNFNFQPHHEAKLTLITGHDIDNPRVVFGRLMKESGAESFFPNSQANLQDALRAVSNMLDSEYTLGFYPHEHSSQLFRKIEVKVHRRGVHVLTRSFVAPVREAAQFVHFQPGTCVVSPKFHPYPYEANVTHGPSGIIYRDNFSNPRSGWPAHKNSLYVAGGYELLNPKEEIADVDRLPSASAPRVTETTTFEEDVLAAYGPWWNDFHSSVGMDAHLEKASSKVSAAGLVFRMNLSGYYALLARDVGKKNKVSVALFRRAFFGNRYAETALIPWTTFAEISPSAIELSVDAVGSQISVFVDHHLLGTVQDDTYDQGYVGFVISGPGRAVFKNLNVEQR